MTTDLSCRALAEPWSEAAPGEAELAAASFLARYGGRTLEAYRHDLRGFFEWAGNAGLSVLEATRPHIELYRAWMEDRGLAASTMDRRLSTVCGCAELVTASELQVSEALWMAIQALDNEADVLRALGGEAGARYADEAALQAQLLRTFGRENVGRMSEIIPTTSHATNATSRELSRPPSDN